MGLEGPKSNSELKRILEDQGIRLTSSKLSNLLQQLKKQGTVCPEGRTRATKWKLTDKPKPQKDTREGYQGRYKPTLREQRDMYRDKYLVVKKVNEVLKAELAKCRKCISNLKAGLRYAA